MPACRWTRVGGHATVPRMASKGASTATWVAALVVLALATVPWDRTPEPREDRAPAGEFSAERAFGELRALLGDERPHPSGTEAHAELRERLVARLRELEIECEVQEALARNTQGRVAIVRNVLGRIGGGSGRAVLLAAHYDSVGAGPGAGDDGSGVATLLECARALRAEGPLVRPILLLFSDAEEVGLVGARAFVERHRWAGDVGAVVNLEARGTTGPSLMFQTSGPGSALLAVLRAAARRPNTSSLSDLVYEHLPNDTDFSVFRERGIPGFNFAFIGGLERYHTPLDDLAHLDLGSLQHHGDQALALARELARTPLERLEGGEAVYFDVLGRGILSWREPLGIALAVAALAASVLRARRAIRLGRARLGAMAAAVVGAASFLALAGGAGWACTAALSALAGAPDAGSAQPTVARAVLAALVLAALAAAALPRRLRCDFAEAWTAGSFALSLVAIVSAVLLPRASHVALVPAIAWGLADLALDPLRRRRLEFVAALAPTLAAATIALPVAQGTELAFGFRLGPALALPFALALIPLWPAWIELSRRLLAATLAGASLVAVAGGAVLLSRPSATADRPTWLNLRYILDADLGRARFEASTFGTGLPRELAAAAPFARAVEPPFPWLSLDRSMFVADAPIWDVAPPRIEVLSSESAGPGRRVRARIRSGRGATRLHLKLDRGMELRSVRWKDHVLEGPFPASSPVLLFAMPREGCEIELDAPAEPVRVWLLDQDWTLPPQALPLLSSRPPTAVPRADGDVSILGRSFVL